jgi:hypothetical protein
MPDQGDDYARFPRGKLNANINRRLFFSSLVNEIRAVRPDPTAHPVYKLSDLGEISDYELARIIPELIPGCQFVPRDGILWGRPSATQKEDRLFSAESPAFQVYHLFNGQNTILDISRIIGPQYHWGLQHAFAYVRGVFLSLVVKKLAAPKERRK